MSRSLPLCVLVFLGAAAAYAQSSTALNLSTDLVPLKIAAANLVPNQPTQDSTVLLESAVKYLRSHTSITSVTAAPGAYYFLSISTSAPFNTVTINALTPASSLTFDFQGSDFYSNHPETNGFALLNCNKVTVQNFTIDTLQQLYTQVQITAVNAAQRQIQYTTMAGFQSATALEALNPVISSTGNPNTGVFIFRNGTALPGTTRIGVKTPYNYTDTSLTFDSSFSVGQIALIQPGDVAVINSRGAGGIGLYASGSNGCTLRNIKVYAGNVGCRTVSMSNSLLEHIEVVPRPGTNRLISSIADGIDPAQPGPNNVVRLCRVIRNCDDGFAPNTFVFGQVQSAPSATTLQIAGISGTWLNGNGTIANGAPVAFEQSNGTVVGTATVVSSAAAPAIAGIPQAVLTFSGAVPAGTVGSFIYTTDPTTSGGMVLERNAVEQDDWAHNYALWGLLNTTFVGNYSYHSAWAGVQLINSLPAGGSDWTTPPVTNLTLLHNVIDGAELLPSATQVFALMGGIVSPVRNSANGQPISASPMQNVYITGNFIANPGASALWIGNTNGGIADENYLLNSNNNPNLGFALSTFAAQMTQPLVLQNSQNISLGTNLVDNSSGQVFVTDANYTQLAAYAPGSTIRLNGLGIGSLANPVAKITDADGVVSTLSLTANAANSLDVALPSTTGLGGAYVTLVAGGETFFGTLFVDSQDNVPQVNQATFQISPVTGTVPAAGATVSLLVVTLPNTPVTVIDGDAFVTPGAGINGSGVVTVTLAANTGAARATTVQIAGQGVTINQAGIADPVITAQPGTQTLATGSSGTLSVQASAAKGYQWYLNGAAIAGATNASLNLSNVSAATSAGTYTVLVTGTSGSAVSNGALITVSNAPAVARIVDMSVGTNITSLSPTFTVGAVIGGSGTVGTKPLLVRADGPSLGAFGITGTLASPTLAMFSGSTKIASNAGWGGSSDLSAVFASVGAFPFVSGTSLDSALFNAAIAGGLYSVQVSSAGGAQGYVIAELYDATSSNQFTALTPRLINVSVLKTLAAGEVFTAGFVVGGSTSEKVLIRADGPALGVDPFNLAGVMAAPQITVFGAGNTIIASNSGWGTPVGPGAATPAQLGAAFTQVSAFPLALGSKDSTVLLTLPPGSYSAQVTGLNGSAGQVIVEVYEVP
jgi:hypothetical protein